LNGASNLLAEIFGEAGRHTRFAVGVNELPLNAAVEVVVWAQVADDAQ
jgi:enamine deaminase RidA (YjgF/YER057c/UK114 family)